MYVDWHDASHCDLVLVDSPASLSTLLLLFAGRGSRVSWTYTWSPPHHLQMPFQIHQVLHLVEIR